jgi:hypothetical protein
VCKHIHTRYFEDYKQFIKGFARLTFYKSSAKYEKNDRYNPNSVDENEVYQIVETYLENGFKNESHIGRIINHNVTVGYLSQNLNSNEAVLSLDGKGITFDVENDKFSEGDWTPVMNS